MKQDTVTLQEVPSQEARKTASLVVSYKMNQIRQIFKEIEGLADEFRLHVTWDGLDNIKDPWGWGTTDRIHYQGDGQWRSSSRENC